MENDPEQNKSNGFGQFAVVFGVAWILNLIVTPLIIFPLTEGKSNGGDIGFEIGGTGCIALLILSFLLAKATVGQRQESYMGRVVLLFVLGLAIGSGIFFVGCGIELKKALGH